MRNFWSLVDLRDISYPIVFHHGSTVSRNLTLAYSGKPVGNTLNIHRPFNRMSQRG